MSLERRITAAAPGAHREIEALGFRPYGQRFEFTHTIPAILAEYGAKTAEELAAPVRVRIAGRVQTLRRMGKAGFAHLAQNGERLQIYIKKDAIPERDFAIYQLIDLGDIIGVEGYLFRTRTGELSVHVEHLEYLAKTLLVDAREMARPGRRGDPLPPALSRSDRQPRSAQGLPHAQPHHLVAAPPTREPRLHRSGNAHDAAALRRRHGAAFRHASQHAGYRPVPAHRAGAVSEAPDGGRPRAGLRNQPQLPQRRHLDAAQPRVHHAGVLPGLHRLPGHDGSFGGVVGAGGARRDRRRGSGIRGPEAGFRMPAALHACARRSCEFWQGEGRPTPRAGARSGMAAEPLRKDHAGRSAGRYLRARGRGSADPADHHLRLPGGDFAALEEQARRSGLRRALRDLHGGHGDRQRLHRVERSAGAAPPLRHADWPCASAATKKRTRWTRTTCAR